MGTTSQHGAALGRATRSVCPGQQPQGGGDELGVKIKLQRGRCRAQAAIPRAGKSLDIPKACKDLCTSQSKAERASGTQLQALITERWEPHASLQPTAGIGKGIPLLPAKVGHLTATSTKGDARSLSCFPKLSQGKAAGVQGSQRGTGWLPTPLSSVTCRFPTAIPMPHRLAGCSQCHNR